MSNSPSRQAALVSVIVPVYNGEDYVAEALESAQAQTYSPIEIIVVDDGSTDSSADIVKRYQQSDSRIKLVQQERRGVAAARNAAIDIATGQYIAPLDADDTWLPEKLREQVRVMEEGPPGIGLVYAWSASIDSKGRLMGGVNANCNEGHVFTNMIFGNIVGNGSAPLILMACIKELGGYSNEFSQRGATGCEDRDLYLRIAERYRFVAVHRVLVGYRQHAESMSSDARTMQKSHRLCLERLKRRHGALPSSFLRGSFAFNAMYLDSIEARKGRFFASGAHLIRAAVLDPGLLMEPGFYKLIRVRIVQLLKHLLRASRPGIIEVGCRKSRKDLAEITISKIEIRARASVPNWKERRKMQWIGRLTEWYSKNGSADLEEHTKP